MKIITINYKNSKTLSTNYNNLIQSLTILGFKLQSRTSKSFYSLKNPYLLTITKDLGSI